MRGGLRHAVADNPLEDFVTLDKDGVFVVGKDFVGSEGIVTGIVFYCRDF